MNPLTKLLTKNQTKIPLFWVDFNYQKYKVHGAKNSCSVNIHPLLQNDTYIEDKMKEIIDYVRENYNMDEI